MDINKHLKMLNLASIKRDRNKSPQVITVVEYDIPEEMPEDMIIIQNEPQKEVQKGIKKKKPKIKKAPKTKKGFLGKLFGGILFFVCEYLHIPVD